MPHRAELPTTRPGGGVQVITERLWSLLDGTGGSLKDEPWRRSEKHEHAEIRMSRSHNNAVEARTTSARHNIMWKCGSPTPCF